MLTRPSSHRASSFRPRRRGPAAVAAILAALTLGLAACDDAGQVVDDALEDPSGDGGGAPGEGGGGDTGGGDHSDDGAGNGDTGDSGDPGNGGDDGDGGGDPIPLDDHAAVGAMGRALLSGAVGSAVVEIDRSPDRDLTGGAVDHLISQLGEHGAKSVSRSGDDSLPSRDTWTAAELREVARAHRANQSGGDTVAVQVLVVSGTFERDSAVGVAFEAGSFAVFVDKLDGGLLGSLSRSDVEAAVVAHELGHLFGLVNLTGEGAFHEDPEHPGHSRRDGSVMFWAVESDLLTQVFEGGPPREFDTDDEDEMARIRDAG